MVEGVNGLKISPFHIRAYFKGKERQSHWPE